MSQKIGVPNTEEEIIRSKVAMAILRTLIQQDMPLPISRIAKEIGSNYVTVRKHMKLLKESMLVTTINYGRRTLYKTNMNNERVPILKQFLEAWNNPKRWQKPPSNQP